MCGCDTKLHDEIMSERVMTQIKLIDAKTANDWFEKNEAIIVDVREPSEYNAYHIAGAHLIPVGSIACDLLPECGNKKIIIHCKLGMRGNTACEKLLSENPNLNVYNLEGGIVAWEKVGYKTEK